MPLQKKFRNRLIDSSRPYSAGFIKKAWDDYVNLVLKLLPEKTAKLILKHRGKLYIVIVITVLQLITYSILFLLTLRAYERH